MYDVQVVADDQLPPQINRVLVQLEDGSRILILTRSEAADWQPVKRLDLRHVDVESFVEDDDALLLQEVVNGV